MNELQEIANSIQTIATFELIIAAAELAAFAFLAIIYFKIRRKNNDRAD